MFRLLWKHWSPPVIMCSKWKQIITGCAIHVDFLQMCVRMYLCTTVTHPHGHRQLQKQLGNRFIIIINKFRGDFTDSSAKTGSLVQTSNLKFNAIYLLCFRMLYPWYQRIMWQEWRWPHWQCFRSSLNIGLVIPTIIYYYYQKLNSQDQIISKIF